MKASLYVLASPTGFAYAYELYLDIGMILVIQAQLPIQLDQDTEPA